MDQILCAPLVPHPPLVQWTYAIKTVSEASEELVGAGAGRPNPSCETKFSGANGNRQGGKIPL